MSAHRSPAPDPAAASGRSGWLERLRAALLPQDCELCGAASAAAICPDCLALLTPHGPGCCPRCGDHSAGGEVCGACLRAPPPYAATLAAFVYGFPLDRLVQHLKYGGRLHLARWWADRLAERLGPHPDFDLVLPMPLHPTRLAGRGFNQAVEIARPLAAATGLPLRVDFCARIRATPPQAELERDQRLRNVRGAFECRGDLTGMKVLLVDDVMTTGASMAELARVVKLHGAAAATVLVGARTLHR